MSGNKNIFDVEHYVRENGYDMEVADYSAIGLRLRCIDDRSSNSDDKKRDIALPGGGLGIVMDMLGALTLLRRKGKHVSLNPRDAIDFTEKTIGAITFHTDEKSVKNRGVACGGCGHCNGALVEPVKYLLSENDAKYFLDEGLAYLKDRLKLRGEKPTVYIGHHEASAVLIVAHQHLGLSSIGKSGERAYIYHKYFHEVLLSLLAHQFASELGGHAQGVGDKELEEAFLESARIRLSVTVQKLAADLPTYLVGSQSKTSVEQL